jgi:hypothetical protein
MQTDGIGIPASTKDYANSTKPKALIHTAKTLPGIWESLYQISPQVDAPFAYGMSTVGNLQTH